MSANLFKTNIARLRRVEGGCIGLKGGCIGLILKKNAVF